MKTIRNKISLIFMAFMTLLVFMSILLNALFLEKFYIFKNKEVFLQASGSIQAEYARNPDGLEEYLMLFDHSEGISSLITDANGKILYSSSPSNPKGERLPGEILQLIQKEKGVVAESGYYGVLEKSGDQAPKLLYAVEMKGGDILLLRKPLSGINESVLIAGQFTLFSGLFLILVGGVAVKVLSNRITRPIINMSSVAESISNLDFSKRVRYDSEDEIGKLGTSINRMSDKLSENLNSLKLDVERRKELVANISHELKSPIGVIKGYAEGLQYGLATDDDKMERYCTVIVEECNRMDSLVRELLHLSMLESGLFRVQRRNFDLSDLIQNVVRKFEPALKERDIYPELVVNPGLTVHADPELMEQVVINFLENAMNHADPDKQIKITAKGGGGSFRIDVFNSGKPLSDEEMLRVWDVFYKTDKSRSRQYDGHGIGLSIIRLIAQLHGGTVGVDNENGGVRFYIEIPEYPA